MHVHYPVGECVLLCCCCRVASLARRPRLQTREADLPRVDEVPALVLVVVVSVQSLLAQVAEVVRGNVGLRAVVGHHISLRHGAMPITCFTYKIESQSE